MSNVRARASGPGPVPRTFEELNAELPLRPVRDEVDYDNAIEQNGMNASALGELLGNRSLGSKILREERELSKEHIRKLCERFAVSADLFI
jgi:hypothetical protein